MHRFMAHLGDLAGLDMVMARREKALRATGDRVGQATAPMQADRSAGPASPARGIPTPSTLPAAALRA